MKSKILVVDDEEDLRDLMYDVLVAEDYEVVLAADGREGLKAFFGWRPDLVVSDILMPEMDGWQLLERIREVAEIPVIMLTALGREQDTVKGLRSGADDYLVKPVRMREFVARVEANLRKTRGSAEVADEYQDSVLKVNFPRHEVLLRGNKVSLSPQEFRLLSTLVRSPDVVLSADHLLDGSRPIEWCKSTSSC